MGTRLNLAESATRKRKAGIISSKKQSTLPSPAVESAGILLAEDDDEMRSVISHHLRRAGYAVTECRDGMELLFHLDGYLEQVDAAEQFDLIISDIRMPGVFGLTVAEGAADCECFPPMILITGFGDAETHQTAAQLGVKAVLDKPFGISELLAKVRQII